MSKRKLTFENKVLNYSISAGVILAATSDANAVVKVQNSPPGNPTVNSTNSSYEIDLDFDTDADIGDTDDQDIRITYETFGGKPGIFFRNNFGAIWVEGNLQVQGTFSNGTQYLFGAAFTENQPIATNPAIWKNRNDRDGTLNYNGGFGNWINVTDRYLPVKFDINGNTHYGWIKMSINAAGTEATISSWAYETSPDTGILAPLPVELISFTALQLDNAVKLLWETATEVNNYGFEIERASTPLSPPDFPSGDEGWEKIGFVQGHGNSNSPKSYEFIDSNLPLGNLQYRLKQIDTDGSHEYYGTITEISNGVTSVQENNLPLKFTLEQNYPNPFNPVTKIKFNLSESGAVTLSVYNSIGEKVSTPLRKYMEAGIYEQEFNAANLPSGFYIYKIDVGGKFSAEKKMLVVK